MDSTIFTDSRGNLLTARTWGRLTDDEKQSGSVHIVANDIYNTPRDSSPAPAPPKPPSSPVRRTYGGPSVASRQHRSASSIDSSSAERKATGPGSRSLPGPEESRERRKAGPPNPAQGAMAGRASMRAPASKASPPSRASGISRVKESAPKPAWTDVPMSMPAKAVSKSRLESITAPQRRVTRESSRPGTPVKAPSIVEKPSVPSLDLKAVGDRSAIQQAERNGESAGLDSPSLLTTAEVGSSTPRTGSLLFSHTIPPPLTARSSNLSARSTARLGSPRLDKAALPQRLQRRTSSLKAETLQTRSSSLQATAAADSVRSDLLDAEEATAAAMRPPSSTDPDAAPQSRQNPRSSSFHDSTSSSLRGTAQEVEVAPLLSSRLGRQRYESTEVVHERDYSLDVEATRSSEVHARLQRVSELHSPPRLGSPRPQAQAQAQKESSLAVIKELPPVSSASPIAASEAFLQERFRSEGASTCDPRKGDGIINATAGVEYEEQAQSSPRLGTSRNTKDKQSMFATESEPASPPLARPLITPRPEQMRSSKQSFAADPQSDLSQSNPKAPKRGTKESWAGKGLQHSGSDLGSHRSQPSRQHQLSRVASLPTSLRSAASLQNRKDFMQRPGPTSSPVRCTILRDLTSCKGQPIYSLYLDDPAKFILAAQRQKRSKASFYAVSLDNQDFTQQGPASCGTVKSNFLGTQFSVFNDDPSPLIKDDNRKSEVGLVRYQTNILGTRGPRKMTVLVPKLRSDGTWSDVAAFDGNMTQRLKDARSSQAYLKLVNKPPKWNDQLGAFCLNFGGRVTHASVKNFQLITEDDPESVILQFGKVGKNKFSMDFQWPMSTLQAFGICLSSFDSKLACE